MFEMGCIVGLGLLAILFKSPPKVKVAIVSNPVVTDVVVFTGLAVIHAGTYSGIMVATIGALVCSVVLSVAKRIWGYYVRRGGRKLYMRGYIDMSSKLGMRSAVAAYA
jgi:hypothetical protein